MTLASLEPVNSVGGFINTLVTAGSNSGGAFAQPTLSIVSMSTVLGVATGTGTASSPGNQAVAMVGANKVLKDMGRTVVSAGRVFRKFAPVVNTGAASTFGVTGPAASGANAGFGAFYLEVGREGAGAAPAPVARYF